MYTGLSNDFWDNGITYIDAWETDDDNEEGKVIAKVYDNGTVEYLDERAKTDEEVQEIVQETIKSLKQNNEF